MNVAVTRDAVVYIGGSGRNGSTLLGQHLQFASPDVFFAGELTHIWRRGYLENQLCSCGQPFHTCEFWSEVTKRAFGQFDRRDVLRSVKLRDRVSRLTGLWLMLRRRPPVSAIIRRQYGEVYDALTDGIRKVAGCPVLVDSSKYPTDLWSLQQNAGMLQPPNVDFRVVHLVRDCRAVVYSWKRKKQRTEIHWKRQLMPRYGVIQTALGWKIFNQVIAKLGNGQSEHYCLVRYEDFVVDAANERLQLCRWLGVRPDERDREDSHSVSGNPCRFTFDSQSIRLDDEWRANLSAIDRWWIDRLCSSEQTRYAYGG